MNYLMAENTRDEQLHVRLKPDVKEDLRIVAETRGLTMSALVYSLIVQTIRAEKSADPTLFPTKLPVGQPLARSGNAIPARLAETHTQHQRRKA